MRGTIVFRVVIGFISLVFLSSTFTTSAFCVAVPKQRIHPSLLLLAKTSSRDDEQQQQKLSSPLVQLASSPLGALAVLMGIVLFHESGHYGAARAMGVHPEELSIGFGLKLVGFQAFGDAFALRAIPAGGYVKFLPETLLALAWPARI